MTTAELISPRHRALLLGVRGFGAAAVWLLAATRPSLAGFACAAALTLLAGLASSLPVQRLTPLPLMVGLESLLSAVIVGAGVTRLPEALIYLLVPAFAAGLLMGLVGAAVALLCDLVLVLMVALRPGTIGQDISVVSPWLVVAAGSALLGAWVQQMGEQRPRDDDAYDSARRLLGQLRTVARRLSAGLDPVGIAQQVLVEVSATLSDRCSAVLVRTDGGVLVPLTFQGADRLTAMSSDDPLVREVWAQESAAQRWSDESGERRILVALPLRVGSRILGVVVAECDSPPGATLLASLQQSLGQHALRLDTALVFDEIRTLATADERRRMAREIHDGIAQEVASLGYAVDELVATAESEQQSAELRTLRAELTRVVSELRLSIFDLRSEVSATTGVSAALSDYVRQVASRSGMTVHLSLNETPQRLRVEVETEMLRIAQEAVTNARRHSGARNLWVSITVDPPHATLTVTDDGQGLGPARPDSYGMKIMRERADRIGADLTIASRPEGGTIVDLTLRPDKTGSLPAQATSTATAPAISRSRPFASSTDRSPTAKENPDGYVGSAHR
jgi:signal transduction histidine kinase